MDDSQIVFDQKLHLGGLIVDVEELLLKLSDIRKSLARVCDVRRRIVLLFQFLKLEIKVIVEVLLNDLGLKEHSLLDGIVLFWRYRESLTFVFWIHIEVLNWSVNFALVYLQFEALNFIMQI